MSSVRDGFHLVRPAARGLQIDGKRSTSGLALHLRDSPSVQSACSAVSLVAVSAALTKAGRNRRTERRLDGQRRRRPGRMGRRSLAGGTCAQLPSERWLCGARAIAASRVGRLESPASGDRFPAKKSRWGRDRPAQQSQQITVLSLLSWTISVTNS